MKSAIQSIFQILFNVALLGSMVISLCATSFAQSKETKIRFSVLDEQNQPVKDLEITDLRILLNKKPLRISSLKPSGELLLRVLILIDSSLSEEGTLPHEKDFAERFIDQVLKKGADTVGIAKFSSTVDFLYDPGPDHELAKTKLKTIAVELPSGYIGGGIVMSPPPITPKGAIPVGSTTIFDAIDRAISFLRQGSSGSNRNVVLLISDGVNTSGDKTLKAMKEEWEQSGVTVYAVGIGDKHYDGVDSKTLKKITESTGGFTIVPSKKATDVNSEVTKLASSMRYFYEATTTDPVDSSKDVTIDLVGPRTKDKKLQVNSVLVR